MPTYGVAVTIPDPWGPELQESREAFGDTMAPAIPPHVTLLPPTEVAPEVLDEFTEHLERVAGRADPFRMVLSGTGTFRPVSPVVFVQVSHGISACEGLEGEVRGGPVSRRLDFPYHPHVTVAHHLDEASMDRAFDALAGFRCDFDVATIELYHHDSDGVWKVLRSFNLGTRS